MPFFKFYVYKKLLNGRRCWNRTTPHVPKTHVRKPSHRILVIVLEFLYDNLHTAKYIC